MTVRKYILPREVGIASSEKALDRDLRTCYMTSDCKNAAKLSWNNCVDNHDVPAIVRNMRLSITLDARLTIIGRLP